jgi:hypothetical protein
VATRKEPNAAKDITLFYSDRARRSAGNKGKDSVQKERQGMGVLKNNPHRA